MAKVGYRSLSRHGFNRRDVSATWRCVNGKQAPTPGVVHPGEGGSPASVAIRTARTRGVDAALSWSTVQGTQINICQSSQNDLNRSGDS